MVMFRRYVKSPHLSCIPKSCWAIVGRSAVKDLFCFFGCLQSKCAYVCTCVHAWPHNFQPLSMHVNAAFNGTNPWDFWHMFVMFTSSWWMLDFAVAKGLHHWVYSLHIMFSFLGQNCSVFRKGVAYERLRSTFAARKDVRDSAWSHFKVPVGYC